MKRCLPRCARLSICAALLFAAPAAGQAPKPTDLTELPLEELLKLRVTSASKKEQSLSRVGAALYVLTREDIASSGAHTIPDLLRLVPGVEVSQINSSQWAISIRGFNSLYSNKVLALMDGRALYQPSFSGVFWDQQDLPIEDIERIEVIRGPDGTIWGPNAVNGVINIVTRHSRDTQGGLITAGGGSWRTGEGLVEYGGKAGSAGTYRVFGKYFDGNNSVYPDGLPASDAWHSWAGGFRSDWDLTPRDELTVQGDLRATVAGGASLGTFSSPQPHQEIVNSPIRNTLGDVMATWRHTLDDGSETTLRVYFDHMHREGEAADDVTNDAFNAEFEHHLTAGSRNDIVWGAGFRVYRDNIRPLAEYAFEILPRQRTAPLFSGFFQDEIRLTNSIYLRLGSKLEHNDYTGFEYEPGAGLVWTPSDRHTLWTSVSRNIRQPDRADFGANFKVGVAPWNGVPALVTVSGNDRVGAEQLYDSEAGYRGVLHPRLDLDIAGFVSDYRNLEAIEPGAPELVRPPGSPPYLRLPLTFANLARARNYGTEALLRWTPLPRWNLSAGYSFLQMSVDTNPASQNVPASSAAANSPKHQLQATSRLALRRSADLTATARYVSRLPAGVDSYLTADAALRWRPRESLEIRLTGRNLSSPRHSEFAEPLNIVIPTEARRSVFVQMAWHF